MRKITFKDYKLSDEILKSLTSVYRVISGKWVNDETKDYEFEEVKC